LATEERLSIWGFFAVLVNFCFLVDLMAFIIIFGWSYVFKNKKILVLEMILQVMAIAASIKFYMGGTYVDKETFEAIDLYNIVSLFRLLRMLYLLGEIK
jgi:hypothetical protein